MTTTSTRWWEHWAIRALIALLPLAVVAGAASARLEDVEAKLDAVGAEILDTGRDQVRQQARVDALDRQVSGVEAEVRRASENISAIYQATGARCR